MNRSRTVPLGIMTVLAVGALATTEQAPPVTGGPIDLGDTAWLLTATGLVLLMTPGLSFFYALLRRDGKHQERDLDDAAELHRPRGHQPAVGHRRLQPLLRHEPQRPDRRPQDVRSAST